jgi:hypothetical protein
MAYIMRMQKRKLVVPYYWHFYFGHFLSVFGRSEPALF